MRTPGGHGTLLNVCTPGGHKALPYICAALIFLLSAITARGDDSLPVPLDDLLTYRVSYLGVYCADMTLQSAPVEGKPQFVQMVMTVETTPTFDAIYKVRSRIESTYNVRKLSTRTFHERSTEKDREKDDLWVVNSEAGRAKRTKNGQSEVFEVPRRGAHDPLAMLYRFRDLIDAPGDEAEITVMTTHGAMKGRAIAEGWEQFESPMGEVKGLKVVQQPVGDEEFGRGGGMTLWLSPDENRVPYRIDFDLSFGKLVAELMPDSDPEPNADAEH